MASHFWESQGKFACLGLASLFPTRHPWTLTERATEKAPLSLSVPQLHVNQSMALRKLPAGGQVLGPALFTEVWSIGSRTGEGWTSDNCYGRSRTNVCTTGQALTILSYIEYLTRTIPLPPLKSLLRRSPHSSCPLGPSVLEELSLGRQP